MDMISTDLVSKATIQPFTGFEKSEGELHFKGIVSTDNNAVKCGFILKNVYGISNQKFITIDFKINGWGNNGANALALYHGVNCALANGIRRLKIVYYDFDLLEDILNRKAEATELSYYLGNLMNYISAVCQTEFVSGNHHPEMNDLIQSMFEW